MILQKLELKNFKRYKNEIVTFPDGLTGIVGANGAGKSSIVEGIVFALYGVQGTGVDSEFVLSSMVDPKEKTRVALTFTLDGHDYTVERIFKKSPKTIHHDAHLYGKAGLITDTVSGVADELQRLIGMSATDFRRTIYAGQDELTALITALPSARKDWFLKIVGIHDLQDHITTTLKTRIDEINEQITGISAIIGSIDGDRLTAEIQDNTDKIATINEKRVVTERLLKEESDNLMTITHTIDTLEKGIAEFYRLSQEEVRIQTSLDECTKQIDITRDAIETQQHAIRVIEDSKPDYDRYLEIEAGLPEIRDQVNAYQAAQKALPDKIAEKYKRIKEIDACMEIVNTVTDLQKLIDEQTAIVAKKADVETIHAELLQYEAELNRVNVLISGLSGKITALQAQSDHTDVVDMEVYHQMVDLIQHEDEIQYQYSLVEEEVNAALINLSSIDTTLASIKTQIEHLTDMGEFGECPHCGQSAGEKYPEILARLKQDVTDLNIKRELAVKVHTEADNRQKDLAVTLRTTIPVYKTKVARIDKDWKIQSDIAELEKSLDEQKAWIRDNEIPDASEIKSVYDAILHAEKVTIPALQSKIASVKREEEILHEKQTRLDELIINIGEITDTISRLKPIEEIYHTMQDAIGELKPAYISYLKLNDKKDAFAVSTSAFKEYQDTRHNLEDALDEVKSQLACVQVDTDGYNTVKMAKDASVDKIATMKNHITLMNVELFHATENLQNSKNVMATLYESIKEKATLDEAMQVAKLTRTMMKGFMEHLLSIITGGIAEEANQIISDVTDGRYTRIDITQDYQIMIEDDGGLYPVERFSGGEQDVIAIALRIAISRFLAHHHQMHESTVLIFDEIFGSQDIERRNNLFRLMREQESRFPQILIISHISDVLEEFKSLINVTRDGKYSHVHLSE